MADKPLILLVEDNLVNQKVAVKMLTKLGYQVDVANNGLEALDGWRNRPYAMILMDCLMPEMDGFQATEKIREAERKNLEGKREKDAIEKNRSRESDLPSDISHLTSHLRIPIIAMTANTMEGDREKCLEVGMDDFIPKPVNIEFLGSVLAKWLLDTKPNVSPSVAGSSPMAEKP